MQPGSQARYADKAAAFTSEADADEAKVPERRVSGTNEA